MKGWHSAVMGDRKARVVQREGVVEGAGELLVPMVELAPDLGKLKEGKVKKAIKAVRSKIEKIKGVK